MAEVTDGEVDKSGNGTINSAKSSSRGSVNDSHERTQGVSGWLMKRSRISHKWRRQWFTLKDMALMYGNTAETVKKKIPLESAEIAESSIDQKDNAFRVKPKDSKRTFYLYAEDETEQHNWMQAICFAKAAGSTNHDSQACVIQ